MRFCVQREGAAHLRDRLALRLLRSQHTAATTDQLMVILPQFAKAYFRRTVGIRRDFIMNNSRGWQVILNPFS
jgi:hypothetical protein